MDNLEQDPEEIPMEQVLAEIRQMLSGEASAEKPTEPSFEKPAEPLPDTEKAQPVVPPAPTPTVPESPRSEAPDYFLLTPAMRCDS